MKLEKPKQLENVNIQKLREICQEFIDYLDNDRDYDEDHDYDNFIFERAMEVIFGEAIWDYINERQK